MATKFDTKKGTIFALLAALLWAGQGVFVKLAAETNPSDMIVWAGRVIGFVGFVPIFAFQVRDVGWASVKPARPYLLVARAIFSLGASYCLYYALRYLSLTSAILLSYTRPLFIPLIVLAVYGKKLPPVVWFALALGFCGIVLILEPGIDFRHPATLVGLLSGFLGASAALTIRRLAKRERPDAITFHYFWMSVILSSIPLLWWWETPSLESLGFLIILGACVILYQMFLSRAYSYMRASVVMAVLYASLVFSTLFDWIFWHNEPNAYTAIGILLVAGSSILAIMTSGAKKK